MADSNRFLDYAGLARYDANIKAEMAKKAEGAYTLPSTTAETLGGVKIQNSADPVPTSTALKADATGTAYVDWKEAPLASTTKAGLVKLGDAFKQNPDGTIDIDPEHAGENLEVAWSNIKDKPELALKTDITSVYKYRGSVATFDDLPTDNTDETLEIGDIYNVEENGMNWAWTGAEWDALGAFFEVARIPDDAIDALFAAPEE